MNLSQSALCQALAGQGIGSFKMKLLLPNPAATEIIKV
jgi:hypothetical protein